MKRFIFFTMALISVLTCVTLISCSDNEPKYNLVITTWECISETIHDFNYADHDFQKGALIKFLSDGKCFIDPNGYFEEE